MKVLIVIDMQNDFISGALGNPETLAVLPKVCERVKSALKDGTKLLYTLDTHGEDYPYTQEGRNLPIAHCIKGTWGHELADELKKIIGDTAHSFAVEKCTFGSKELPKRISELCGEALGEIELIGVCTDICVISNALLLKAFFPETRITVRADSCAGTSAAAHDRALEALKMCQIEVIYK